MLRRPRTYYMRCAPGVNEMLCYRTRAGSLEPHLQPLFNRSQLVDPSLPRSHLLFCLLAICHIHQRFAHPDVRCGQGPALFLKQPCLQSGRFGWLWEQKREIKPCLSIFLLLLHIRAYSINIWPVHVQAARCVLINLFLLVRVFPLNVAFNAS